MITRSDKVNTIRFNYIMFIVLIIPALSFMPDGPFWRRALAIFFCVSANACLMPAGDQRRKEGITWKEIFGRRRDDF